jgi:hypothetical protein
MQTTEGEKDLELRNFTAGGSVKNVTVKLKKWFFENYFSKNTDPAG